MLDARQLKHGDDKIGLGRQKGEISSPLLVEVKARKLGELEL